MSVTPPAVVVHIDRGQPLSLIDDVSELADQHPGDHLLALKIGDRLLSFGAGCRVTPSEGLVDALGRFGRVEVRE